MIQLCRHSKQLEEFPFTMYDVPFLRVYKIGTYPRNRDKSQMQSKITDEMKITNITYQITLTTSHAHVTHTMAADSHLSWVGRWCWPLERNAHNTHSFRTEKNQNRTKIHLFNRNTYRKETSSTSHTFHFNHSSLHWEIDHYTQFSLYPKCGQSVKTCFASLVSSWELSGSLTLHLSTIKQTACPTYLTFTSNSCSRKHIWTKTH